MDLKNLKIEDLKNINYKQLLVGAKSRPDIFIIIILIALTICGTIFLYSSASGQAVSLNSEIVLANEKLKVVEEFKKIEKEYKDFKEKFPKSIPNDQFITKLSEFALKNSVQTLSFSQPQKSGDELLDLTVLNFNIASEDYPSILMFIKDIETSPYALRLNKLNATLIDSSGAGTARRRVRYEEQIPDAEKRQYIEVNLEVGLLELKK